MDYMHIIIILLLLFILYRISYREGFGTISTDAIKYGGTPITDPALLDPNTYYVVGTLKTSNTTNAAQNGGQGCIEFPKTIYVPAKKLDATCAVQDPTNLSLLDDAYYTMGSGVQGFTIFPRFFTKIVPVNVTPAGSSTPSTLVLGVQYNDAGTVAILATNSLTALFGTLNVPKGTIHYSTNITSNTPTFTQAMFGGEGWREAQFALGNGTNKYFTFNDSGAPTEGTLLSISRIVDWGGARFINDIAFGSVPNIAGCPQNCPDNILAGIGFEANQAKGVFLWQIQGSNYFTRRLITTRTNATFTSITMDKTVLSTVEYVPGSGTTSPISNIYVISLHGGPEVGTAPGGIGLNIGLFGDNNTQSANQWYRVVGAPNNIKYVSVGVDLRAFAVDDTGALWICDDVSRGAISGTVSRPGTSSSWVKLGTPQGVRFSRVFYRKNLIDTAFAIDTTGKLYYQTGVNAVFNSFFTTNTTTA